MPSGFSGNFRRRRAILRWAARLAVVLTVLAYFEAVAVLPIGQWVEGGQMDRTRTLLITAIALVAAGIVAAAALLAYLILQSPGRASRTPQAAAIDEPARQMCAELLKARRLEATGSKTPEGGYGASADQMDAYTARIKAQDYAIKSKVPAIQKLAAEAPADVAKLQRWCAGNGL